MYYSPLDRHPALPQWGNDFDVCAGRLYSKCAFCLQVPLLSAKWHRLVDWLLPLVDPVASDSGQARSKAYTYLASCLLRCPNVVRIV
jgi:hypothetical protein